MSLVSACVEVGGELVPGGHLRLLTCSSRELEEMTSLVDEDISTERFTARAYCWNS